MNPDKAIREYIRQYESFAPLAPDEVNDPVKHRERYRRLANSLEGGRPEGIRSEDTTVPANGVDVPVRIYRGQDTRDAPCCLFFHGGGWMIGDLDTHDAWAAELCAASGATVVATDYRLGPEQPYPAAFDDCYAVLTAVAREPARFGIDGRRIAVYGDSAGGNLAAAVSLKARDTNGPRVAGQVLVYPALHHGDPLPSWESNRDAPILSLDALNACWRAYLRGREADAYAAPLLAGNFADLPPAWIITAEHDPLRDDGLLYAERLSDAGGQVEVLDASGLVHGCFRARHSSELVAAAWRWSVEAVRAALAAG